MINILLNANLNKNRISRIRKVKLKTEYPAYLQFSGRRVFLLLCTNSFHMWLRIGKANFQIWSRIWSVLFCFPFCETRDSNFAYVCVVERHQLTNCGSLQKRQYSCNKSPQNVIRTALPKRFWSRDTNSENTDGTHMFFGTFIYQIKLSAMRSVSNKMKGSL